ncbi:hypothetical protein [Methylobacterium gnaphalii]|uniref:Uncharacterized protein n=1 Tax=Methylobacterium gnaphalii TaxID=1010610 RepID=A0A512JIV8_9HYPH|nr:hypothetical protein [Methylobacterium gnaphalii]GEP09886.1 hypothetical protein MGN01_17310 [Methylobacterium gnaphalii]GJD68337.1 hypothetical protein MMMDOFMJ_1260 [Methylobacterium gnaphalii]GLS49915.1 hypothetical protein GCM10007885_27670 [Methylobacterium gnaphalii]
MPSTRVPAAPDIRFRVEPGDVPAEKVARRLHISLAAFEACKVRLFMRGFPRPDPDTGNYDLEAVDRWRHRRHPSLFPELTPAESSVSSAAPAKSLGEMARDAFERGKAPERRRNG